MLLNKIGVKITEDKPEKLPRLNDSRHIVINMILAAVIVMTGKMKLKTVLRIPGIT